MVLAAAAALMGGSILAVYLIVRSEEQRLLKRDKAHRLSPPDAKPN